MLFVIFEVTIKKEYMNDYVTIATQLKEELVKNKGFIRSERFASLTQEGKLLSLSVWENEESIAEWRNQINHRMGQKQGRDSMFESFTITVTTPVRTYSDQDRTEAPIDSNEYFAQN